MAENYKDKSDYELNVKYNQIRSRSGPVSDSDAKEVTGIAKELKARDYDKKKNEDAANGKSRLTVKDKKY